MSESDPVFEADDCPERSTESDGATEDAIPIRIEILKQLNAWIYRIRPHAA